MRSVAPFRWVCNVRILHLTGVLSYDVLMLAHLARRFCFLDAVATKAAEAVAYFLLFQRAVEVVTFLFHGVNFFNGARSVSAVSMMSTVIPSASAICWMVT